MIAARGSSVAESTEGLRVATQPSGTVTFLFVDIEGSTPLWDTNSEAMQAAVARHDEIVASAIAKRGGFVLSIGGDGFGIAFQSPIEAVRAAVARLADASGPIRVTNGRREISSAFACTSAVLPTNSSACGGVSPDTVHGLTAEPNTVGLVSLHRDATSARAVTRPRRMEHTKSCSPDGCEHPGDWRGLRAYGGRVRSEVLRR